jgi:uncharacterized protein (TIGR02271 family)
MAEATSPKEPVQTEILLLQVEEIAVSVRKSETAHVRIETVTSDVEHQVREALATEAAEIVHVPRGHFVDTAPSPRFEGDLVIVPVLEERVVVERRLFLKEELHIRRVRSVADHNETVLLRRQDVTVRRTPSEATVGTNTTNPKRNLTMSDETIVAVFSSASDASAAIADLRAANVPESAISQHSGSTASSMSGTSSSALGSGTDGMSGVSGAPQPGFWASIFGGDPGTDTGVYDRSMASGSTVVTVKVPSQHFDSVSAILERHNPLDIDEAGHSHSASTTTTGAATGAVTGMAAGSLGTAAGMTGASRTTTTTTGNVPTSNAGMAGSTARADDNKLQLSEEQLAVGKRMVNSGTARIRRYVVETPVEENVTLREESVRIERRPVTDGRPVTDADFTDKVVEMTESREEAVVSKTARVVEEVAISKDIKERTETVRDTVRRDEVEIVKGDAAKDAAMRSTSTTSTTPITPKKV